MLRLQPSSGLLPPSPASIAQSSHNPCCTCCHARYISCSALAHTMTALSRCPPPRPPSPSHTGVKVKDVIDKLNEAVGDQLIGPVGYTCRRSTTLCKGGVHVPKSRPALHAKPSFDRCITHNHPSVLPHVAVRRTAPAPAAAASCPSSSAASTPERPLWAALPTQVSCSFRPSSLPFCPSTSLLR